MKGLMENVEGMDYIIRELHKLSSRLRSGQFIDAWRGCNALLDYVVRTKKQFLYQVENKEN